MPIITISFLIVLVLMLTTKTYGGKLGNPLTPILAVDDTDAIQDRIDLANETGQTVFFPPGNYLVSDTIDVTKGIEGNVTKCCRLEGENANAVTIKLAPGFPAGKSVFKFISHGAGGPSASAGIKNMTILCTTHQEQKKDEIGNPISGVMTDVFDFKGTGIELNCLSFAMFENVRILGLNTGIHLKTDNVIPGINTIKDAGWTEFNQFTRIELFLCKIGIRMSNGNPKGGSFHGNNFDTVIINIPEDGDAWRIGDKCTYYNGRFNIYAWAHSDTSNLINCDGSSDRNIGNISIECGVKYTPQQGTITLVEGSNVVTGAGTNFNHNLLAGRTLVYYNSQGIITVAGKVSSVSYGTSLTLEEASTVNLTGLAFWADGNFVSKVKGTGHFWFDGHLIVAGGDYNVSVEMDNLPADQMNMPGFCCNNNLSKTNFLGGTNASIIPVAQFKEVGPNAVSPMVYGLSKDGMQSIGINTYTGPNNGLYLTQSGFQQSISQAKTGFYLDATGNELKSFAEAGQGGFNLNTETGFAIRFGRVNLNQRPINEEFQMQVILEAMHLISGRLYITTGNMDNAWAASAVFDIHYGPNTSPANRQILVQESIGWDPNNPFVYKLNAEVKLKPEGILMQDPIQLSIGANT